MSWPAAFPEHPPHHEEALEALLSLPDDNTVQALRHTTGDLLILGAGGKMGPTLARMARRALDAAGTPRSGAGARRVIAVSRFSDPRTAETLLAHGVEVHRADLADPREVRALPPANNAIWMAGQKFGSSESPVTTWNHNVVASVHAAEQLAGARIVCFSTGNVYSRTPVSDGGSREHDALAADGEYAASCIGRERVFEAVASRTGSPLLNFRLFYACDLRYGVVTDVARKVLAGQPVDISNAAVNYLWQGDANRLALRSLTQATVPSRALNVTGPLVSVRAVAERIATHAGVSPQFIGAERKDALVANTEALHAALPHVALADDTLLAWTVAWIQRGGRLLDKPTKFEVRDGRY